MNFLKRSADTLPIFIHNVLQQLLQHAQWSPCRLLKADAEHTLMYLSMFYHDYLSRVCMKSGLRGIVYIAGPRCTAERDGKVCGKVLDLPMKLRDKDRPGHIICEYCPASYSQEELSNLMKDRDPKVCSRHYSCTSSHTHTILLLWQHCGMSLYTQNHW